MKMVWATADDPAAAMCYQAAMLTQPPRSRPAPPTAPASQRGGCLVRLLVWSLLPIAITLALLGVGWLWLDAT